MNEQHEAVAGRLLAAYGLGEGDAVLVRPDGYIAGRCDPAVEPELALQAAVTSALGLPPAHEMAA